MDTEKLLIYENRKANSSTIWLLHILLGWSYGSMDKIGMQFLFYITCGGMGIWALIRLFTLSGAIKDYNRNIAASIGLNNQEMATLGLM